MKREYEIGLIINPETADEDAEKIKTSITDILEKGDGTIENIDDWGRKPLAYPIEKHKEGIYVFIKTMSPGDVIAAVERRLKLNEKVMRFIVIRLDDKFRKTNKLEKKWKRMEKFSRKPAGDSDRERTEERPAPKPENVEDEVRETPVAEKKAETAAKETVVKAEEKEVRESETTEEKKEVIEEKKLEEKAEETPAEETEAKEEKKEETVKKPAEKETEEKKEEKPAEEKEEKTEESEENGETPEELPAGKTAKKAEEKVEEEAENAETK